MTSRALYHRLFGGQKYMTLPEQANTEQGGARIPSLDHLLINSSLLFIICFLIF